MCNYLTFVCIREQKPPIKSFLVSTCITNIDGFSKKKTSKRVEKCSEIASQQQHTLFVMQHTNHRSFGKAEAEMRGMRYVPGENRILSFRKATKGAQISSLNCFFTYGRALFPHQIFKDFFPLSLADSSRRRKRKKSIFILLCCRAGVEVNSGEVSHHAK